MSEKIGGAKGSRLDEDFVELERVSSFLDGLMYLQNRPAWCFDSAFSLAAQQIYMYILQWLSLY